MSVAIVLVLTIPIQAKIIVPNDYPTIQQAINAASPGETIVIKDGTYTENVKVNKSVTIISENGSANCIVQAASNDHVFEIAVDNVTISGFTIKGATSYAGVYIKANSTTIQDVKAENNYYGIKLEGRDNAILDCNLTFDGYGIYFLYSSNNNC